MVGAILAAAGLASSLIGGIGSANAADKQRQEIAKQEARNNAWYERNYYQDYLSTSTARSAMRRVEDTLDRKNREAQATAAVTGATPEAVEARREGNEKILSDTVGQLASRSDARKDNIDAINQQNQDNISQQRMSQYSADEQGDAGLQQAGINAMSSGLNAEFGGDTTTKDIPKTTAGAAKSVNVTPNPATFDKIYEYSKISRIPKFTNIQ